MNRKYILLISILLISALMLTACPASSPAPAESGGEAAAPAEEAPAAEAAATEAPAEEAAAGGPVTISYLGGAPGFQTDVIKQLVDQWNSENSDIQVEFINGPSSATDRYGLYLQTFQAQSSDIDVMEIDVIWPGDLAEHLLDLNQYGAADMMGDYFPAIVENNTVDGALVGAPWYTDGGLLYYRTDLLEKYGYDAPPATWDELEEMAQTIQDGERAEGNQDFWGFVWQGKAYEGLTCDALEWVYSNGGGTIVSPAGEITIDNAAAAAALDRAAAWIGVITPPGVTGFQEEDSRAVWQGGNAAFMRNWPYAYNLGQAEDSAIAGLFDVTSLPGAEAGQSAATLGGWQMAVSKYSANPDAAAKFALWMVAEAQQKYLALNASLLPTIPALYDDAEIADVVPFMPNLLPVFTNAVARPSTITAPNYNEASTIFFSNVSDVLTGKQSGEDATINISLELEDLTGLPVGAP
ncbi:MAG: ABC transporter substrate-binding protein [Caldilineaceae bacterium]|nr:ABC transporter substrate-binding protein [Caldilineaceae bacterium]